MKLSPETLREVRFEGRRLENGAGRSESTPARLAIILPGNNIGDRPAQSVVLDEDERAFLRAVLAKAGLQLEQYRGSPLKRRLWGALRAIRCGSLKQATAAIEAEPRLASLALNVLLIGHTSPFRDEAVFDELRTKVLPLLTQRTNGIRVWSVGCSSGCELVSVAMLLAEQGVLAESRFRGSDCRAEALKSAQNLDCSFLASIPSSFEPLQWTLPEQELKEFVRRVEWRVEDILNCCQTGVWDLILCRNLSIYLEP